MTHQSSFQRRVARKTAEINDHRIPVYWRVAGVGALVLFGGWLAVDMASGDEVQAPLASYADWEPAGDANADDTPDVGASTEPSAPTVPAGEVVKLKNVRGEEVEVPSGALELATLRLRALFDPELAAQVPLWEGGTVRPAAKQFPSASVGTFVVAGVDEETGTWTLAASTDADGAGTEFGPSMSDVTVRAVDGVWKVAS